MNLRRYIPSFLGFTFRRCDKWGAAPCSYPFACCKGSMFERQSKAVQWCWVAALCIVLNGALAWLYLVLE